MPVLRKLIIGTAFGVLTLMVVSLVAAEEQGAKADGKTPVTTGSSDGGKTGSKQTFEVPSLLRSIPGESEADKFKWMAQFIKGNRPRPSMGTSPKPPKSRLAFCAQFMEDLVQMRNIEAIEPDVVTGSDQEIEDKLNLKHCEDVEPHSNVPPGVNPRLYVRQTYGFNYVSDIGGPPYRFYNIQLVAGKKTKYPVLHNNAHEGGSPYTGFALLDLKKCDIVGEIPGHSEMSASFEIGRNVLVRYKEQVFALLFDGHSRDYRLDLYTFSLRRSSELSFSARISW